MDLILIRHGQSEWNAGQSGGNDLSSRRSTEVAPGAQGNDASLAVATSSVNSQPMAQPSGALATDTPLTAWGCEQAERVGAYLRAEFNIIALYSSTLLRARATAEIINKYLGLERIIYLDALREFSEDYSPYMPRYASPIDALHLAEPVRPPQVSSYYAAFQARVQHGLETILMAHLDVADTDVQIAVVSHGGVMGTIIRTLTGSHHFSLHAENTGIHILRWQAARWHILALNRIEHLQCAQWRSQGRP